MPRILDYHTGDNRDPFPDIADAYLLDLEEELRTKVDWLLGLLDRSLRATVILDSELSAIRGKFNDAFSQSNPSVEIMASGSLANVLASSALEEALEEAADEEVGEDEQPCTQLKGLLDAGELDENNEEHLTLARGFLEQALSF